MPRQHLHWTEVIYWYSTCSRPLSRKRNSSDILNWKEDFHDRMDASLWYTSLNVFIFIFTYNVNSECTTSRLLLVISWHHDVEMTLLVYNRVQVYIDPHTYIEHLSHLLLLRTTIRLWYTCIPLFSLSNSSSYIVWRRSYFTLRRLSDTGHHLTS